jgi:predicted GNAT family N-acyltransferase
MSDIKIRLIKNKKELNLLLKIREIVFIKGQNVPVKRERDNLEGSAKHVIVLLKNKPIGCARVRFIDGKAKLERIALLPKYQRKGFGKKLMAYLINYSKKHKVKGIYLHGQCRIQKFYEDVGFKTRGKVFMDGGMRHYEFYMEPEYS